MNSGTKSAVPRGTGCGITFVSGRSARAKGWLGDPSGHGTATQFPKANAAGPEGVESDGDTVADNDT